MEDKLLRFREQPNHIIVYDEQIAPIAEQLAKKYANQFFHQIKLFQPGVTPLPKGTPIMIEPDNLNEEIFEFTVLFSHYQVSSSYYRFAGGIENRIFVITGIAPTAEERPRFIKYLQTLGIPK